MKTEIKLFPLYTSHMKTRVSLRYPVSYRSYPDSLEYKYWEPKITNPDTNIYSCLEQSSTNNISFIDENEESSGSASFLNKLKTTRIANINRLMIDHMNINSIRNIFEMLSNSMKGNLDILMISKIKLDSTFQSSQYTIEGHAAPIRFDRNDRGRGILRILHTRGYPKIT